MALSLNLFGLGSLLSVIAYLAIIIFVLIIITFAVCILYKCPLEFDYDQRPSLLFLLVRGLCLSIVRKQGSFHTDQVVKDRQHRVVAKDFGIDRKVLQEYAKLCGYEKEVDTIPPVYMDCAVLPLMMILATDEKFKLSSLGLIHIRQRITQHCSLDHLLREPCNVECFVEEYRPTARGVETDFVCKVFDRREMCVWEGVTTTLSRTGSAQKAGEKKHSSQKPEDNDSDSKMEKLVVKVPGDYGLKYAKVSGDYNPHHLYPITAKLLGFKKPIVQGLWTIARSVAQIEMSGKFPLKPPFDIDAHFKRPLFMPGTSVFAYSVQGDTSTFRVTDEESGVPQLIGSITTRN